MIFPLNGDYSPVQHSWSGLSAAVFTVLGTFAKQFQKMTVSVLMCLWMYVRMYTQPLFYALFVCL